MILKNRKALKKAASGALRNVPGNPRKIAFLYIVVSVAATLLPTLLSDLSSRYWAASGGLSSFAAQSATETITEMLSLLFSLLSPIWTAGFLLCSLKWIRREKVSPRDLLGGFSRMWPVFRLSLLKGVLTVAASMAGIALAVMLFCCTSLSDPFLRGIQVYVDAGVALEEVDLTSLLPSLISLFVLILVLIALFSYVFLYRLRFAEYFIVDDRTNRARAAMAMSSRALAGRTFDLLKLDLSFWWYYALSALLVLLLGAGSLLPLFQINLLAHAELYYWGIYLLYIAGSILLYSFTIPYIQATYACAYVSLTEKPVTPPSCELPEE